VNKLRFAQISISQKSIVINSAIMLLWWIAFNPGFYSGDSFAVLEMARTGNISSDATAIWAIFVKILTFNGANPEIAVLFFSQLLAFSVSVFAHSVFNEKIASWSSAVLCMTPLVGAMGITLWHDIPMNSGFLLVATGIIRYVNKSPHALVLLTSGIVFSTFRYNGIPTILLTLSLIVFIVKSKKLILTSLLLTVCIGGFTAALDFRFSPSTSTHADGLINWMRYDLSCYAATFDDDKFFQEEFNGKTTRDFWKSSQACTWFNDSEAFYQRPSYLNANIPSAWLELLVKEPLFVFTTHMKRHEYLNPIPLYGPPRMPFIHTTIEYARQNINFWNDDLVEKIRHYPRVWNYFNFIFGYSGFWLMVILFFAWQKKNKIYLGLGILGSILNAGLFIFAIIPDGRFTLFVLIAGQIILIGECVTHYEKRNHSLLYKSIEYGKNS
jgi:hypothetical protein